MTARKKGSKDWGEWRAVNMGLTWAGSSMRVGRATPGLAFINA